MNEKAKKVVEVMLCFVGKMLFYVCVCVVYVSACRLKQHITNKKKGNNSKVVRELELLIDPEKKPKERGRIPIQCHLYKRLSVCSPMHR